MTLRASLICFGIFASAFLVTSTTDAQGTAAKALAYPSAPVVDVSDDYHGTLVADPYRWMEDLNHADLKPWIEAQNTITRGYLDAIPARSKFKARLEELWNYETYSQPTRAGNKFLHRYNPGLADHATLMISDTPCGEGSVVIDPNTFDKEAALALGGIEVSLDGRYMAYALRIAGSDWTDWYVRDLSTNKDLADHLTWIKNSGVSWHPDNSGFFYSRYPEPKAGEAYSQANTNSKVYFHKVGTTQSDDILIYERPDSPELRIGAWPSEDGTLLYFWESAPRMMGYATRVKSLKGRDAPRFLLPQDGTNNNVVGNDGSTIYVQTDRNAPRYRIVAMDLGAPEAPAREIIPQQDVTLDGVDMIGDSFVCQYTRDCTTEIRIYDLSGKEIGKVDLPGDGTVRWGSDLRSVKQRFFTYTDGVTPATVYQFDADSRKVTLVKRPKVDVDVSKFESRRVFFRNRDGLKVPLFISHRKGLVLDGTNPTILYGYGGFNANTRNGFSSSRIAWLELGGVFVQACLRGDGDYGEAWHSAATRINKQRTFDDFIDAAEFLIKSGYTKPVKLAISGGSNGGLLVGACVNQRPDLFGAAVPSVGVMDMLRFQHFTVGAGWIREYGSSDDPLEFQALHAISPYHNIKPGVAYPSILVTTADTDDRVVPSHSYKYAARLQALAKPGDKPRLIRIETKGGHGGGTTTSEALEYTSDYYAFLVSELRVGEKE